MDSISLTRLSLPSVAIMGSSITPQQFTLLKSSFNRGERIVLALDFDGAGQEGTANFLTRYFKDIYYNMNDKITVMYLSEYKDPGEYLDTLKGGDGVRSEVLEHVDANSRNWLEWLLRYNVKGTSLDTLSESVSGLSGLIRMLPGGRRTEFVMKVSGMVNEEIGGGESDGNGGKRKRIRWDGKLRRSGDALEGGLGIL